MRFLSRFAQNISVIVSGGAFTTKLAAHEEALAVLGGEIRRYETQAERLILDLAPNDCGPRLFGQGAGDVELQAQQAVCARVRQER